MQGLVETPLYGGFVARKLREGVASFGVSNEGSAKAPILPEVIKTILFVYRRFHGQNPPKPPRSGNNAVYQERF
jgi:hypothetical protein